MDNEVLFGLDQAQDISIVVPQRIHHIVVFRVAQASGVEETSDGTKIRGFCGTMGGPHLD